MKNLLPRWLTILMISILILSACAPAVTQTATPEPTQELPQVDDSGGTRIVSGSVTYTNAFFTEGVGSRSDDRNT